MVRRAVALGAVVAITAVVLLWAGTAAPAETDGRQPPQTTPEGFANAEFEIRVHANGSTRWTVRASRPLENGTDVERFRSFAERFETAETEAFRNFRIRARRLVAFGTNATGREMNATGFTREARVDELGQTRGVVELTFLWTNFTRMDGQRVVVDDVFQGGMFVDDGQRLVISREPGLVFDSVTPPPDSQAVEDNLTASETVTWLGERNFPDRRPRAVLVPPELTEQDGEPSASGTERATTAPTPGSDGAGGIGVLPFVLAFVVLLGLGGGFALYSVAAGDTRPVRRPPAETDGVETVDAADSASTETDTTVTGDELLSDEDRVLKLLDEHGGRMKQVNIVDETDWSKSKVSMLLSEMDEDGTISKLRVGRENIISKAGEEPDAAGSPFDDE
jgi:uncharacterized membrane protein